MYDSQNPLIANDLHPIIGDIKVQEITIHVVDKYIQTLQKTPPVSTKNNKAKTSYVTKPSRKSLSCFAVHLNKRFDGN